MDELRENIKKTGEKTGIAKNKEIAKCKDFEVLAGKELEKSLLKQQEKREMENIREFIERYQK